MKKKFKFFKRRKKVCQKICEQCGGINEREKSIFCSDSCKTKNWKIKNQKEINKKDRENREKKTLKKRQKLFEENKLFCLWCGLPLPIKSTKTKYCDNDCKTLFWNAVKSKENISIKIDERTIIQTNQYDKIQEIRARYIKLINSSGKNEYIKRGGHPLKIQKEMEKEFCEIID